jgi:hypothetical protein
MIHWQMRGAPRLQRHRQIAVTGVEEWPVQETLVHFIFS